jgi:drug/metabolite transporter (DMT)-like permease|tara:strand:+ start:1461 stop:1976 length:516 start_codon:yes stop_codon:yes gene_type:complete
MVPWVLHASGQALHGLGDLVVRNRGLDWQRVFFSEAFKYSLAIYGDVILLTTMLFGFSAATFAVLLPFKGSLASLRNVMLTPQEAMGNVANHLGSERWPFRDIKPSLLMSSALFLGGTLLTMFSLSLMPSGIAHVVNASEPLVTITILCLRNRLHGMTTVCACINIVIGVI